MTKYVFFSSVILMKQGHRNFLRRMFNNSDNVYTNDENELSKNIMSSHVSQVLFALGNFLFPNALRNANYIKKRRMYH